MKNSHPEAIVQFYARPAQVTKRPVLGYLVNPVR